ncbi:unnamed protein product [Prunus brigantina]
MCMLDAKIITFHLFYFSLGFRFSISRLFKRVFHTMGFLCKDKPFDSLSLKLLKDEAITSRVRDVSPLRTKLRIPFAVHDMHNILVILLKSSTERLKPRDFPYKDVYSRPGSSTEKHRAANFPLRSSSRLH